MDTLSDIFRTLRVQSTLYFRAALSGNWGLAVPPHYPASRFHVVIEGACYITVEGKEPVLLRRGDLAVVPHGAKHVLQSSRDATIVPLQQALDEASFDGYEDLVYGEKGETTTLVCGHFSFEDMASHPIIDSLPPLVHIRAEEGYDFLWLDAATRTLGQETTKRSPGWQVIVDRSAEILFIQILRVQLAQSSSSVVAAFFDKNLALSLNAIHCQPEKHWSVESLASVAGMSRTAFALRFRELMGKTPMAYVNQWRLQKARVALLESALNVARIAERSGYRSEAAFSRAFHQLYGKPPATYRRMHNRKG